MDMPAEINETETQSAVPAKRQAEYPQTSNFRFAVTILLCLSAIPILFNIGPIAMTGLLLYLLVLRQILKATSSKAPAIVNDPSLYRRFVRPVSRIIIWGPVALIVNCILLAAIGEIISKGIFAIVIAITLMTVFYITYRRHKAIRPRTYESDSDMDGYASKRK